jgi:hypothetical protein
MINHIHNTIIFALYILILSFSIAGAAEKPAMPQPVATGENNIVSSTVSYNVSQKPLPVYLSTLTNLNDYSLFANGGWDGNWYVGFNVCWMVELPKPLPGNYSKAFIGAKLGRMKTRSIKGKPVWEEEPIPGSIYISVNSTPSWKQSNSYFLTDTRDIPLESDPVNALEGVGESRWFWTEVPLSAVNSGGSNFLALWSPTEYFVSTTSSPILAGGWGGNEVHSWLNNDVKGYPPLEPKSSLKTGVSAFEPAIAIKLVPAGTEQEIIIKIRQIADGRAKTPHKTFIASITGEEIEKAWLEIAGSDGSWNKHGAYVFTPPYSFSLRPEILPEGKMEVRVSATDVWGNTGSSDPVEIEVSPVSGNPHAGTGGPVK